MSNYDGLFQPSNKNRLEAGGTLLILVFFDTSRVVHKTTGTPYIKRDSNYAIWSCQSKLHTILTSI